MFGDVTSKEVLAYFTMHGASMSWEDKVRAASVVVMTVCVVSSVLVLSGNPVE